MKEPCVESPEKLVNKCFYFVFPVFQQKSHSPIPFRETGKWLLNRIQILVL